MADKTTPSRSSILSMENRVIYCGWLSKKQEGTLMNSWDNRFFILHSETINSKKPLVWLDYFETSEKKPEPKKLLAMKSNGRILVQLITKIEPKSNSDSYKFNIIAAQDVETRLERMYCLEATAQEVVNRWIEEIKPYV